MPERGVAIQKLYDACKATFANNRGPFSAQTIQRVRSLLDKIKPSDVGLDESNPPHYTKNTAILGRINGGRTKIAPPISYLHIYECEHFSMGIFCLPATSEIPLHNHPGMTVLSKLLYGSMHVKAFDWVDHTDATYPRAARLAVDRVMSAPCEAAVLYPTTGGNIHAFTAVTNCAVLDVLAPPYSSEDGRHCNYYRDLPYSINEGHSYDDNKTDIPEDELMWLEEFPPPDDFTVRGAPYKGPKIIA